MFKWLLRRFSDGTIEDEYMRRRGYDGMASIIPDEDLITEAEDRDLDLWQEPIDTLTELDDSPGNIYVWEVDSEQKRKRWNKAMIEYQEQNGELQAVHIVLVDQEELHEMDFSEIEPYLD